METWRILQNDYAAAWLLLAFLPSIPSRSTVLMQSDCLSLCHTVLKQTLNSCLHVLFKHLCESPSVPLTRRQWPCQEELVFCRTSGSFPFGDEADFKGNKSVSGFQCLQYLQKLLFSGSGTKKSRRRQGQEDLIDKQWQVGLQDRPVWGWVEYVLEKLTSKLFDI